jgi:hypothetical protein
MNYQSIYDQFIADRRSKKHGVDTYTESHHVLPRSLGGGDGSENLIDLLPEDHFFAHLLLAKIHGGMLWVPVVMWLGGDRRNWAGRRSRLEYGWAKKAAIQTVSGSGAHQYDHTVYRLEHKDGRTFHGTQAEISVALGLTRSGVNLLVKGKMASLRGWYLEGKRPPFMGRGSRKGTSHPMAVQTKTKFIHVDGRKFVGTQYELHLVHGVSKSGACELVNGKRSVSLGWYVEGRPPRSLGRAASYLQGQE